MNSDLFGLFLLVRDVRLFGVLQSHFQLGGTHVSAHHRGKVSGQQQSALSWAAAHVNCQLKGPTFLTKYSAC